MKLYFSQGACSRAPHIILRELGRPFDLERVDLATKTTATGADYRSVNPLGYVPALQLDDGSVLTEVGAILVYLADLAPEAGLAPAEGTFERYRLLEALGFVATELHKNYSALFAKDGSPDWKTAVRCRLAARLDVLETRLARNPYLLGAHFSVADAYLYVVLSWSRLVDVDLSSRPAVRAFVSRVHERPSVGATARAEKP